MSTNGKLDPTSLTRLSVGGLLTPAAANSFERWRVAASKAGVNLTITSAADAYRIYEVQERIFTERYVPYYTEYADGKVDKRMWNGQAWFRRRGTYAAAVPGTSNHGWAIAIDIANVGGFNSAFYNWLSSTGPALGWSNDEGRSVNEPWHWRYSPSGDSGGGSAAPSPTPSPTPKPEPIILPEEEDKMFRIRVAEKTDGVANASGGTIYLCRFGNAQEAVFRALSPADNEAIDRAGIEIRRIGTRDYSENEKNLMRAAIIGLRDSWKVN